VNLSTLFSLILLFSANAALSLIPAFVARKRGYSFVKFYFLSFFVSFIVVLLVIYNNPNKSEIALAQEPKPEKSPSEFVSKYLSLIILLAVLLLSLLMVSFSDFFDRMTFIRLMRNSVTLILVAFAVVITARAKGVDFSIFAVFQFGAIAVYYVLTVSNSLPLSIAVAVIACALIGAINGVFIVLLKLPSIIVTIVTSSILALPASLIWFKHNKWLELTEGTFLDDFSFAPAAIIMIALGFIVSFAFVYFTKLKVPFSERKHSKSASYFVSYIISSLFGCIAGIYLLFRAAFGVIGESYPVYILLIFGAVASTKLVDNKYFSVPYAFLTALVYSVFQMSCFWLGVASHFIIIFQFIIAAGFVITAFFANRIMAKQMFLLKENRRF
jgi:simple sugar transport system permease protein